METCAVIVVASLERAEETLLAGDMPCPAGVRVCCARSGPAAPAPSPSPPRPNQLQPNPTRPRTHRVTRAAIVQLDFPVRTPLS